MTGMTNKTEPMAFLEPPLPGATVLVTQRSGGVSTGPWSSLNLGQHVNDAPAAVAENRSRLRACLPGDPFWLKQVHGIQVANADEPVSSLPVEADAAVTRQADRVLAILTADCLPVVLVAPGKVLAVAHAGWRGLAAGVLEASLAAMQVSAEQVYAYLGPCIGPEAFEVGADVREAFLSLYAEAASAFADLGKNAQGESKWRADLPALATQQLLRAGVKSVASSGWCTYSSPERFYSYRREPITGRFATLAWLQSDDD